MSDEESEEEEGSEYDSDSSEDNNGREEVTGQEDTDVDTDIQSLSLNESGLEQENPQGIKGCKFEYDAIKERLVHCYGRYMEAKRNQLGDSDTELVRYSMCIELAMIWDTLMRLTNQTFFNPTEPADDGTASTYSYKVDLKDVTTGIQKLSATKLDYKTTLDKGQVTVEVTYANPIYGNEMRKCTLEITADKLDQLLSDSCDQDHDVHPQIFKFDRNVFRGKRLHYSEEMRDKLDLMIVKEKRQHQEIVEEIEAEGSTEERLKGFILAVQRALTERNEVDLKEVFQNCARMYVHYDEDTELETHFLTFASKVYDHLLISQPFDDRNLELDCDLCGLKHTERRDFHDDRKRVTYKALISCSICNIIYLIRCTKCHVRYVGQTKDSLCKRYSSKENVIREQPHFEKKDHSYIFRVLQVVRESDLFENEGFKRYVLKNPAPLEGLEKLWIDRLIDKSIGDLNKQVNHTYLAKRLEHTAELLDSFTDQ